MSEYLEMPGHEMCLVCGQENPTGMQVRWRLENDLIVGETTLSLPHQGPPGHVHGGAIAAMLDEAMGFAVGRSGIAGLAANLDLNYRKPTPLGVPIRAEGWVVRVEGRKVFTAGRLILLDSELVAVESTGLYIQPRQFNWTLEISGS